MAADRCGDCDYGLFDYLRKYSGKPKDLFELCVRHKLILEERLCDKCGNKAVLYFERKAWQCQKKVAKGHKKKSKCSWQESIYKNTFFEKSNLDLETILLFINVYVRECFTYRFVRNELSLSDRSICDWASFSREVLIEWCIKREGKIGGDGKIVEIDESKFGKRKYNVGRLVEGQWVFGGVCRETRDCFMVPVEKRDRDTLLHIKTAFCPVPLLYRIAGRHTVVSRTKDSGT